MNALAEIVNDTELPAARPASTAPVAGATVGAAAERFARLTLEQAPQTQRTYRGCLDRFSAWLAEHHAERHGHQATPASQAPVEAITADAIALYLQELEHRGLAASTIKKDRAAINRFAKYLHALRAIDATEILMIQGPKMHRAPSTRDSLDQDTWQAVELAARGRAAAGHALGARDHAIITLLGACGLRNEEVRSLRTADRFERGRRTWLHVAGKARREREFPLTVQVAGCLTAWSALRPAEIAGHPLLFPRLGRPDAHGSYARAAAVPPTRADDGRMSSEALRKIVAPVMRGAGVGEELCHPHVLRHTFATLYMKRDGARLEQLQVQMGHASIDTTAQYLHTTADELEADATRRDARWRMPDPSLRRAAIADLRNDDRLLTRLIENGEDLLVERKAQPNADWRNTLRPSPPSPTRSEGGWRFVCTPNHASWLNQVECLFSILHRRVLGHGHFDTPEDLAEQMLAFVETRNQTATPFRWTYTGKVLGA